MGQFYNLVAEIFYARLDPLIRYNQKPRRIEEDGKFNAQGKTLVLSLQAGQDHWRSMVASPNSHLHSYLRIDPSRGFRKRLEQCLRLGPGGGNAAGSDGSARLDQS